MTADGLSTDIFIQLFIMTYVILLKIIVQTIALFDFFPWHM